jgi:hypothetical protein
MLIYFLTAYCSVSLQFTVRLRSAIKSVYYCSIMSSVFHIATKNILHKGNSFFVLLCRVVKFGKFRKKNDTLDNL